MPTQAQQPRAARLLLERRVWRAPLAFPASPNGSAEPNDGLGSDSPASKARLTMEIRLAFARETSTVLHSLIKRTDERRFAILAGSAEPLVRHVAHQLAPGEHRGDFRHGS